MKKVNVLQQKYMLTFVLNFSSNKIIDYINVEHHIRLYYFLLFLRP